MIITGQSGIGTSFDELELQMTQLRNVGKSLLLLVILAFRISASLPTAYVRDRKDVFLFTVAGAKIIPYAQVVSRFLKEELTAKGWILFDSNASSAQPEQTFTDARLFIVRATSLREDRLEWMKKTRGVFLWCMKTFTFEELLMPVA